MFSSPIPRPSSAPAVAMAPVSSTAVVAVPPPAASSSPNVVIPAAPTFVIAASYVAPAYVGAPLPEAPSTAAPPAAVVAAPPGPFHFANLNTIRLTPDNYLFWRAKGMSLLRSHCLLDTLMVLFCVLLR